MQTYQSLLSIPKKYFNEKFLLSTLVSRYKVKFRTWRIMADEEQIGMVTSASRPIIENGKVLVILVQFAFLSQIDKDKISKFEGHRCACISLFSRKPFRVVPDSEKPGVVKEKIRAYITAEIFRRRSFWLRKVWDSCSKAKIEVI